MPLVPSSTMSVRNYRSSTYCQCVLPERSAPIMCTETSVVFYQRAEAIACDPGERHTRPLVRPSATRGNPDIGPQRLHFLGRGLQRTTMYITRITTLTVTPGYNYLPKRHGVARYLIFHDLVMPEAGGLRMSICLIVVGACVLCWLRAWR